MRIEVVRVVKAELDESEFETVMLALEQVGRYADSDDKLGTNARKMRLEFGEAIGTIPDPESYGAYTVKFDS